MITKEVVKQRLNTYNDEVDVDKVYKAIVEKAKELEYDFVEKEQTSKPTQYGDEITFVFEMSREVDPFGKLNIKVEGKFNNLNKVKGRYVGDGMIKIKGTMDLDYDDKFGVKPWKKILLKLYVLWNDPEIKNKYAKPLTKEVHEMQEYVKEKFTFS